jgi:peptide/nickel transport system ATP-binding protein
LKFIQIVFQNPDDSLNPRHTVAEILASPLRLYFGLGGDELRQRSLDLLRAVRLGEQHIDRFPAQLSGGEKQRVAIARGFAAEPRLLLCDEVTSALDVSVQAAVIDLLIQLKSERDVTLLFVSHDLAVVRVISDRVAILYHGELVEHGTVDEVYAPPFHPYTEALLSAVLEPEVDGAHQIILADAAAGKPTRTGCPFATRCPRRLGPICDDTPPPWRAGAGAHALRCHISVENLSVAQTESSAAARARA